MKLKDYLKQYLSKKELNKIKTSYDIVGDIAIIELTEGLEDKEKLIAEGILKINKNIKTILKKSGIHEGTFRTQKLEYVLGEKKKETIYKENNIKLIINPEKVYFSPRLSTERKILLENLKPKKVLVMFSGAGPYSLVAYKFQPNHKRITSIEINPEGHKYALKNLEINKSIARKNRYYKELKKFATEKLGFFNEKEILNKISNLTLQFINGDVKKEVYKFKLRKVENLNIDYNLDNLENISDKEILNIKKSIILLENVNFENILKFIFLYNNNNFIYKNFIFKTNLEKNYLLEILEEVFYNNKDILNNKNEINEIIKYDEIFMPLPKDAKMFLEEAFYMAKKNSIIHLYDFVKEEDFPQITINKINKISKEKNRKIKILQSRKVGQYSPRKYRVCIDFKIL